MSTAACMNEIATSSSINVFLSLLVGVVQSATHRWSHQTLNSQFSVEFLLGSFCFSVYREIQTNSSLSSDCLGTLYNRPARLMLCCVEKALLVN